MLTRSRFTVESNDVFTIDGTPSIGYETSTMPMKNENNTRKSGSLAEFMNKEWPNQLEDSGFFDVSYTSHDGNSNSVVRSATRTSCRTRLCGNEQVQQQSFCSDTSVAHEPLLQSSSSMNQNPQQECLLPSSEQCFSEYCCSTTILPDILEQDSPFAYSSTVQSPIPEQSFGPLEKSVLNGILNDPLIWDADTSVGNSSRNIDNQTEISGQNGETYRKNASRRHSIMFERILCNLKRKRESPRKKTTKAFKESGNEIINFENLIAGLPSSLFIEQAKGSDGLNWKNKENEISSLEWFPNYELRDYELTFGETLDQREVTRQAYAYRANHSKVSNVTDAKCGVTKSAGIPTLLWIEMMNRRVEYWKI